jgi:hypothetical protein
VDTLFADVSEFQNEVDDSYPYEVISIRSNDGDYLDHKWAANYQWCKNAADSGKLKCFLVYFVWRQNWQDTLAALKSQIGSLHPKMAVEIDLESWGGQITGDNSDALNATYQELVSWLVEPKKVRLYGNAGDINSLWPNRPANMAVRLAAYGSNPDFPGKDSHQYTDGNGYGDGLPEGASPFGNCDMNSADGLSPDQFAAACGATQTNPGGPFMALTDQQQADLYNAIMGIAAVVSDNQQQLRGPAQNGWQQLGQTKEGLNLTGVDALSVTDPNQNSIGAYVAAIKSAVEALAGKAAN